MQGGALCVTNPISIAWLAGSSARRAMPPQKGPPIWSENRVGWATRSALCGAKILARVEDLQWKGYKRRGS
jgi:hypothetical protein